MSQYNRRSFVKRSAAVAATAAAASVFPAHAFASPAAAHTQSTPHPFFANARHSPEVIAHRGGDGQWPGETMRALRGAAKAGADVLEMDVFLSLDNKLVLMHDHEVEKTTEGTGRVNRLESGYLQTLNAGHKWSPDGKTHPFRDRKVTEPGLQDLRVPLLEEVFREFTDARMVVEMKKADRSPAAALSQMIKRFGMTNKVLVASFEGKYMEDFRALSPEVATSFSLSGGDLGRLISGRSLSGDGRADPTAIQLPHQLVTDAIVRRAHERNIKVHAWTVNDLDKMYLMKNRRVDGIITDYPGPLLAVLERARPL